MSEETKNTEKAATEYHVVVLHSDGLFVTESFSELDALVARLKELIDKDVSVSCFQGTRLAVSKPPMRHLLTPDGNHPLFDLPAQLEPDDTGYLGVDPIGLADPPQLKTPSAGISAQKAQDDFFDDADNDILGAFDNVLPDPDS